MTSTSSAPALIQSPAGDIRRSPANPSQLLANTLLTTPAEKATILLSQKQQFVSCPEAANIYDSTVNIFYKIWNIFQTCSCSESSTRTRHHESWHLHSTYSSHSEGEVLGKLCQCSQRLHFKSSIIEYLLLISRFQWLVRCSRTIYSPLLSFYSGDHARYSIDIDTNWPIRIQYWY